MYYFSLESINFLLNNFLGYSIASKFCTVIKNTLFSLISALITTESGQVSVPVFDKCLAPKWEYTNMRNQHNNYFCWKRSGVKYPCLGRNTNPGGIKHARAFLQHVYLQQQACHIYLFVPPLNFLKSLLENVKAKKGIPTSQACPRNGAHLEMTEINSSCSHQGWHKLQFSSLAKPQTMGNQRILLPELPGLCRETKSFHFPAAKGDFYVLETLGFRQNYLKVRNTECQGEDTEIIKSLWAL